MKRVIALIIALTMLVSICVYADGSNENKSDEAIGQNEAAVHTVTNVAEYLVEPEIITEIDYDYIGKLYENGNDVGGGCSAIAKVTDDGTMLVGRNMDLYFSNNPAYIVRTAVEGCYETIGVAYSFMAKWPTYEQVLAEGITDEQFKQLPFITTDIMNSEGLYVEINMRSAEFWATGDSKFACSGTNPEAQERVYIQCVARYIAENCATVDEAVAYVNNLNIFTGSSKYAWNYCFILADAAGHYGLLEIAENKVKWLDYQQCQTNFYIDDEFASVEELKCGLGRYDYLMDHINSVQNEEELYQLMDAVSYLGIYSYDCPYDVSSEFAGTYPWWTNEYMENAANKEEIDAVINYYRNVVPSLDKQSLRDLGANWQSVFTVVANCSTKTMKVRFFEDEDIVLNLSF